MYTSKISFMAEEIDVFDLRRFKESMEALGLRVELGEPHDGKINVEIEYPGVFDARLLRTRDAGRWPSYSSYRSPVFNNDTTAEEALIWLEGHTPAEGMEALVCSRSTYFRRMKIIREAVGKRRDENERRKAAGSDPLPPELLQHVLIKKQKAHN